VMETGRFSARLLALAWLSPDTVHLDFERPPGFLFAPGQGIRLCGNGVEREYSLVCAPSEQRLSLCVQVVAAGALSPLLARLEDGSILSFSGPHGYFIFQPSDRPAVFVATGTGIAPFVAMAKSGIGGFTLLHGASSVADLHYRDVVQPSAGRYLACLSRPGDGGTLPSWGCRGRVSEVLRNELAPGVFDFYLCGSRTMVRDVAAIVDERFPGSRVFSEVFS
jgi:benzoate/toluate 1,2-dioxygenase reductase subunit